MPTPQQRMDLDRVLKQVEAPKAIVIMLSPTEGGFEPEMATKAIDDDRELFWLLSQVVSELGEQLFSELPAAQQRQATLMLPTAEDARRLGILNNRPRRR